MLLGQELKFKNKLCNLKLGTFFSALPGLGVSAPSGRVGQKLTKIQLKRGTRPQQQKVKSGEEWVKSARTLFTPRNADKHRDFGAFGEE